MVTALQALMRNDWALAGTLMDTEARQSSNPGDKRQDAYYDKARGIYRSEPIAHCNQDWIRHHGYPQSQPYDERFGQANPENIMADESKEKFGISPDGMIDQLMIDAMMPERKWTADVR
jgi:hypothetical protein